MPIANVRGVDINYEVLGDQGPWVTLQPGSSTRSMGLKSLGDRIAEAGCRVLVYDRRNCGASGISFEGGNSENEVWADDLHALLSQIGALPAYIGGSSSGCRLALLMALRHPSDVRGLLLWRVTGGAYAAERFVQSYYTLFIDAARQGGMEAVSRTSHFSEVIAANPGSRARLMAYEPQHFIGIMEEWRRAFNEGAKHPVIGLSPAELRSLTMSACIIPGNDRVHPREAGQTAHRLMPNSEYHKALTKDRPDLDVALEDWNAKEDLLAAIFIDFLRRTERRV